jgi:glycosyltransferase involved in cell wall biosynthesis
MKLVIFAHPSFIKHQSMPRYANMLLKGMLQRGHEVEIWSPKDRFYKLAIKGSVKKWLGYIDQYIVFPFKVKSKLRNCGKETLFVFADQALGPWVPLVSNRSHIIHCHDFLALKSALGIISENPTSFTGKLYQNYIRKGFSKGKNFISISKKTQEDLHSLHLGEINSSALCYNGLNRFFEVLSPIESRSVLEEKLNIILSNGYVLHIGGNQYYKNRKGVIEIYDSWRSTSMQKIPLLLIGSEPSNELAVLHQKSLFKEDIHFITNLSDEYINLAYSGAICLLFPSLDEGFGWPIIEAMASGCPVITTNIAPMTEVGGKAAFYIDRRYNDEVLLKKWLEDSVNILEKVLSLNSVQRAAVVELSLIQSQKFTTEDSINTIELIYEKVNQIL